MSIERFSITSFKKQLSEIGSEVEKIEFISSEVAKCIDAIQDVKYEASNFETTEIKLTVKTTRQETPLIEVLNTDRRIRRSISRKYIKLCAKKIINELTNYMIRIEAHQSHYKTKYELTRWNESNGSENNAANSKAIERIVWKFSIDKLLELFDCLFSNEIIPKYTKEEILVHFKDEKQNPFFSDLCTYKKFSWLDSDNRFAVFANELAERGAIDDEARYQTFAGHFVNKKGNSFTDLPQKRNYTENFTKTGDLIRQILDSMKLK